MKQLLKAIQNRLKIKVPQLKYIADNWGQLDYFGSQYPVKYPCCLIDIAAVNYSDELEGYQLGDMQIKLLVSDLQLTNSSVLAPQSQKDKAFEIYDLIDAIQAALHGWSEGCLSSQLLRRSLRHLPNGDGLLMWEITYAAMVEDDAAARKKQTRYAKLEISSGLK